MSTATSGCITSKGGRLRRSEAAMLAVLVVAAGFSRIPFLGAGHGVDFDAWRLAGAARTIAATHMYTASRLPGYPLHEGVSALLHSGGPLALNGATAVLSLLAVVFFALSARALGSRDFAVAGLALAFTPVVFINSTNSMDYVWALAFAMGSLYFVLAGKPLAAGLMLGGAVACRMTSGAMFVPLSIVLVARDDHARISRALVFGAAMSGIAILAFVPVVLRYGPAFFWFLSNGRPPMPEMVRRATEEVWGRVGLLGILIALTVHVVRRRSVDERRSIPSGALRETMAWALAITLYIAAFVRLPIEAGYLVPIVPFSLLLMGRLLTRSAFLVVCTALVLSPLLGIGRAGLRAGPVLTNHQARVQRIAFVNRILTEGYSLEGRNSIVVGGWLPQVQEMLLDSGGAYGVVDVHYAALRPQPSWGHPYARVVSANDTTLYVHEVDKADLGHFQEKRYRVYYAPGQKDETLPSRGFDLELDAGTPLLVE